MSLRHQDLCPHDIHARHQLCDRVLHLNPRVDFDEEPFTAVSVDQKLHRARIDVACLAGQRHGGVT